jgi:hypothetical protein
VTKLLQSRQPLPGILDLGEAGVSFLPKVEEFPIMLDFFCIIASPLGDLSQRVEALGVDVAEIKPARRQADDSFESALAFSRPSGCPRNSGSRMIMY